MHPERWEHGSEFHWIAPAPGERAESPWDSRAALFGSGRDALRALVAHGIATRGWRRVLVPSYLCQEVVGAVKRDGARVASYVARPGVAARIEGFERGDALLIVNTLGLAARPERVRSEGVEVIEDHTHDPWSPWARTSDADFAVVALRKTLPIPDGGAVWSPRGHALPAEPALTEERERASARKLAAMLLKARYLEGADVEKSVYRELARAGEEQIASGAISGMSRATRALLRTFPVESWRTARRAGFDLLAARLAELGRANVLHAEGNGCPFSVAVVFDGQALRENVRRALIEARIYPAVLWPLEDPLVAVSDDDVRLSRTLLSVHCDARYSRSDLDRVADVLLQAERSAA